MYAITYPNHITNSKSVSLDRIELTYFNLTFRMSFHMFVSQKNYLFHPRFNIVSFHQRSLPIAVFFQIQFSAVSLIAISFQIPYLRLHFKILLLLNDSFKFHTISFTVILLILHRESQLTFVSAQCSFQKKIKNWY